MIKFIKKIHEFICKEDEKFIQKNAFVKTIIEKGL